MQTSAYPRQQSLLPDEYLVVFRLPLLRILAFVAAVNPRPSPCPQFFQFLLMFFDVFVDEV
jgi:hypothetical protein